MPDLSVVIRTYNERGNVPLVCERLAATLNGGGVDWEIIFSVDPSIDGTEQAILALRERAGIQLLSLGVTGEYVGRIYDEVKHRPRSIVESQVGFDERSELLHDRAARDAGGA
jgi:hypothetical protein